MARLIGRLLSETGLGALVDELTEVGPDLNHPLAMLEAVERGDLDERELDELRGRALMALRGIEATNHAEDAGAVVTGPPGAGERMRARRDTNAEGWRLVFAAVAGVAGADFGAVGASRG